MTRVTTRWTTRALMMLALALPAAAQNIFPYVASTGNVSVVASAYAATVQQTATNSLPVSFPSSTSGGQPPAGASIYCSVSCVATISVNGTAATATTGTVTPYPGSPPAVFNFFTASNASGGTTLGVINIAGGVTQPLDMSLIKIGAGGTATNLTISIASTTATVNITFYPLERH